MNALEIKEFRKKYGLTQSELAELLGVTVTTVRSWEYNQRNISASSIKLIENYIQSVNPINHIRNEVTPVPEDDYMMVEFEDLEIAAGKLGSGGEIGLLPEKKKKTCTERVWKWSIPCFKSSRVFNGR